MKYTSVICFVGCCILFACSSDDTFDTSDAGTADTSMGEDATVADGGGLDGTVLDASSCAVDLDQDGFCSNNDCDDRNASVNPGQTEICGNAIDDDCNTESDEGCLAGTTAYYVDQDSIGSPCDDNNVGSEVEPWCTIDQANNALSAGDTVYIRSGTYVGATIRPVSAGTSETARITYSNYPGETVTLTGSVYCVRLQDTSFISILGIRFFDCERNLYISASSNNNVGYCEFDTPRGAETWAGSRIHDGSQYNRIYRSVFSRYGQEAYYSGSYQDYGCNLDIGNDNDVDASDHNLIIENTFFHGGHHILGVYANYNVVRRNTFHNEEWYACNRTSIGGLCGNRNVILNSSQPDNNIRNVIEGNRIVFSGVPPDQVASAGLGVRTQYNIVRRNIFYHNDSSGLSLSANGGNQNDASNNYIYHNVFYKNGYLLEDDWDPRKTGLMLARWVDSSEYNDMTGVAIKANIFHENQLHAIFYYYVDEQDQAVENNWEHQGDPLFAAIAGTPDPGDFSLYDFHLQPGSPCLDNGGFLTQTVGDGQDSRTMLVDDAGYFTDGHGLVVGDLIQLEGKTKAVSIEQIDYNTNTLTLSDELSWSAGAGVSLAYLGSAPDQGVYEHESP